MTPALAGIRLDIPGGHTISELLTMKVAQLTPIVRAMSFETLVYILGQASHHLRAYEYLAKQELLIRVIGAQKALEGVHERMEGE